MIDNTIDKLLEFLDSVLRVFGMAALVVVLLSSVRVCFSQQPEGKTRNRDNLGNHIRIGSTQLDGVWDCPQNKTTCTATSGGLLLTEVGPTDTVFSGRMLASGDIGTVWRSYELTVVSNTEMDRTKIGTDPDDGDTLYVDRLHAVAGSELWQTGLGIDSGSKQIFDGLGNQLPLQISETMLSIGGASVPDGDARFLEIINPPPYTPGDSSRGYGILINQSYTDTANTVGGISISTDTTGANRMRRVYGLVAGVTSDVTSTESIQVFNGLSGTTIYSGSSDIANDAGIVALNLMFESDSGTIISAGYGISSSASHFGSGTLEVMAAYESALYNGGKTNERYGLYFHDWVGSCDWSAAVYWDATTANATTAWGLHGTGATNRLESSGPTYIPMQLVGATGQTAPLLDLQSSSGTVATVEADGEIIAPELRVTTQYTPGVGETCSETGKIVTNNADLCWCNGANWLCVTGVVQ